jgi:SDR family mycofactocin-dependent oxidoreductase
MAVRRVALVTGAARGIGAATVALLDDAGWAVVALDRACDDPRLPYAMGTAAELDDVVAAAQAAIAVRGDTSDHDVLTRAVALAEDEFGGLDAVIAVAGVVAGGVPLWEVPLQQEQAVIEVNLGGVLAAARVGVPALLRRPQPREGRFLAVASAAATRGLPMLAAYCAAKAGVTGLVRGLAAELRGTGVTANAVLPGSTATRILDESARLYKLESSEAFSAQQPLERLLDARQVAAALVWLAGPEGAALTGASIPVDGGLAL